MLTNIIPREQLRGLARLKSRQYLLKAVRERELDEALEAGWQIDRKLKSRVRVRRLKPRHQLLEDRVWTLCTGWASVTFRGKVARRLQWAEPALEPCRLRWM